MKLKKSTVVGVALGVLAMALVALAVWAMPNSDILLTPGASTESARLHTGTAGHGPQAYDVKANGTGEITFYRRAASGPAGYPRGAVVDSWTYQLEGTERHYTGASKADSCAVTDWGTATRVIVTGNP